MPEFNSFTHWLAWFILLGVVCLTVMMCFSLVMAKRKGE